MESWGSQDGTQKSSRSESRSQSIKDKPIEEAILRQRRRYQNGWTYQQDKRLVELYKQYPTKWKIIAEKLGTHRTNTSCYLRFRSLDKKREFLGGGNDTHKHRIWKPEQDQLLQKVYQQYPQQWKKIATFFPHRNKITVYNRYRLIKNIHMSQLQRDWTPQQDALLIQLFQQHRYNWQVMCKYFERCNPSNCYLRYKSLANMRRVNLWSQEQDNLLLQRCLQTKFKWNQIHKDFPDRTLVALKLRYQYFIKDKQELRSVWTEQESNKLMKLYDEYGEDWKQIQNQLPNFNISEIILEYYQAKDYFNISEGGDESLDKDFSDSNSPEHNFEKNQHLRIAVLEPPKQIDWQKIAEQKDLQRKRERFIKQKQNRLKVMAQKQALWFNRKYVEIEKWFLFEQEFAGHLKNYILSLQ